MPSYSREKQKKRHHSPAHSESPEPRKERRQKTRDHHRRRNGDHEERRNRSRSPDERPRDERRRIKREGDVQPSRWERDGDEAQSRNEGDGRHEQRIKKEPRNRGYADEEERQRNDDRRRDNHRRRRNRNPFEVDDSQYEFGRPEIKEEKDNKNPKEKEEPNFGLSGKLAEDTNTYKGVVIKYNEPAEARKPKKRWRFYPFKGEEALPVLHLHRQSAYLLGRDRKVADIPVDHPSCSKQHAALQFRLVEYEREDRSIGRRVRPYVIDLGSTNGTYVNNNRIESQRYVELFEKDVVKFGFSSREYVLLTENTDTTSLENDEGVDVSD